MQADDEARDAIMAMRKSLGALLEVSGHVRLKDIGEGVEVLTVIHEHQQLMNAAYDRGAKGLGLVLSHSLMAMVDEAERLLDLMYEEWRAS